MEKLEKHLPLKATWEMIGVLEHTKEKAARLKKKEFEEKYEVKFLTTKLLEIEYQLTREELMWYLHEFVYVIEVKDRPRQDIS